MLIAPVAAFTGIDIALSNTSFIYLNASFVEMVKPSSLVWVLALSISMNLRSPSWLLGLCVALMLVGQIFISYNATEFDMKGFTMVSAAAFMAAARCTLIEVMLHGNKLRRKLNSLEVMMYIMPGAGVILLLASFIPYKSCARVCKDFPLYCLEKTGPGSAFCSEAELLVSDHIKCMRQTVKHLGMGR